MPIHIPGKYAPFAPVSIPDRTWPDRAVTRAPVWCSVDLRDGNQALERPMGAAAKRRLFDRLVATGFKEIEVGFPSANATEFAFVRSLVAAGIPEGVTIGVLAPAREAHILRAFEALEGAPRAIVHLYNSTSPVQRRVVFGLDEQGVIGLAARGARWVREQAAARPETAWTFEYSPESFTSTEPGFALAVCEAVLAEWAPTPERKAIVNLPATVEVATPNAFADRVEWFARNLRERDAVVLSVHPHNDRGTAVAAAELAVMAGAERVEGTLFGNGERTGNVCLVTLALNLHTQGVDPRLDLSDLPGVRAAHEAATGMAVPPRHPYAGDLVFTAFSGSHQDAIRKGLKARAAAPGGPWEVPYLPIDPADVGRAYAGVIRVNGLSGKGGAAHLLEREAGLAPPRALEAAFGARVKEAADQAGGELSPEKVAALFAETYVNVAAPWRLADFHGASAPPGEPVRLTATLAGPDGAQTVAGAGNGPIDALCDGLRDVTAAPVRVLDYAEHAVGEGAGATAAAYVRACVGDGAPCWGVALDTNVATASLLAVVAAVNRALAGAAD
jgi:2-isopropylmalate synthase